MTDVAFLGTRVDPQVEPVPSDFLDAEIRVRGIVAAWLDGTVTDDQAVLADLAACNITDGAGRTWAYGATTGRWFTRPAGGEWTPTHPTLAGVSLPDPT